jgi:hypothetical protein
VALIVGSFLALGVELLATAVGFDRDRAFYPTMTIVIASYSALFAVMAIVISIDVHTRSSCSVGPIIRGVSANGRSH